MSYTVNSNTFKNSNNNKNNKWKQHKWIPLVIIVVIALALVALNWFLIDFTSDVYNTSQQATVEQVTE